MATLDSLSTSITKRPYQDLVTLISNIRSQRRKRPEPKERKVTAKSTRNVSKKNPKQQDLFALASSMSKSDKDAMAATLMNMMNEGGKL
jgi:hypothetical protein